MNHDEIVELLGAYALDAVDDDERAIVAEHLLGCARCRAEVEAHQEVATFLAHGGGDAPAGLWERIAGSLEEPPPGLQLAPVAAPEPATTTATAPVRRPPRRIAVAALAAAAAVVVVVVLGAQVYRQDQRIDELQTALDDPLVPAFAAAVSDPGSRLLELASTDGDTVVRGVVTDDGTAYLRAGSLPPLDGDRTYQLWGGADDRLVSLGVVGADPEIVSFRAEPYDLLAITEEAVPGVVQSANPPVVAGSLD